MNIDEILKQIDNLRYDVIEFYNETNDEIADLKDRLAEANETIDDLKDELEEAGKEINHLEYEISISDS